MPTLTNHYYAFTHSLVEAIITDELAGHSQNKQLRQFSPEPEFIPATTFRSSLLMMLSQDEIDELFGVNQY
ncbi:14492_t:CDS:2 [Dentiscutata heterogama]|uniref:14492_t:CDS:1 n=1 Tax=Dentiscutata heterogama TaxID=1316150 RepID=A0ACA9L3U7_9GLOM|nr:14492_t:CDS:2 [Dentiscutata heterogama]